MIMAFVHYATINAWESLAARLRAIGEVLPPLALRLVAGYIFWHVSPESIAGGSELTGIGTALTAPILLGGAILLGLGLCARFAAFGLLLGIFWVTAAAHAPNLGTPWTDPRIAWMFDAKGGLNPALLLIAILLPIIFQGPGRLSVDNLLLRLLNADATPEPVADAYAWSLALLALGIALSILTPMLGVALVISAVLLFLFGRYARA
jgi:putative oxidoreductase